MTHHSWNDNISDNKNAINSFLSNIDNREIPEYTTIDNEQNLYDMFYNNYGCFLLRSVYTSKDMDEFNSWCKDTLQEAAQDGNSRHPIQKDKLLINNLLFRLSRDNPKLFLDICNNSTLTNVMDILLGFGCFGSATAHWVKPGGNKQLAHVDYPIHMASSPFWDCNINKLKRFVTRNQLNNILPHHSIQILVAVDDMNIDNGSTQVVPGSHLLDDIDIHIQDHSIKKMFEPHFKSVSLKKGDILVFNRRLVHRGGHNKSDKSRNALIFQCVNIWTVPQEINPYDDIKANLERLEQFSNIDRLDEFLLRIKQPYPKDVSQST